MYARAWMYIALTSMGFFSIGVSLAAITRWPAIGTTICIIVLSATLGTAKRMVQLLDGGRYSMRRLLREICRQTTSLLNEGYELLVPPPGVDSSTLLVRIGKDRDGVVILEEETRDGKLRRYSIDPSTGRLLRSALGDTLTGDDHWWCHEELTPQRLEEVLSTLTGAYSPLRSAASL